MRHVRAQALLKAEEARLAREDGKEVEELELEENEETVEDGLVPIITVEGPDGEEGNVLFDEGGGGKKFLKKIFKKKKDKMPLVNEVY